MWIEEITLDNIKCFDKQTIKLGSSGKNMGPYPWVTFLGENGTGKSTVLQALALLMAGPEGSNQLLKPIGWLKKQDKPGKLSIKLHQTANDPNKYGGTKKERTEFTYTLYVTGNEKITINNKVFTEPIITEDTNSRILPWLRENALLPKGKGWFGAGYGAFRRLTREGRIIVPSLQTPLRYTNFLTQFRENEPLEAFETWMVYLDYKISKNSDDLVSIKQKDLGIKAINRLLPDGNAFDSIDSSGRIWFNTQNEKVSTISLSDGFRSILALGGDLIWRLIEAFPESDDPLKEQGVVLIDELDIHLHPTWQRSISGLLRETFPYIQFIMATHSPLVAAGAGDDAVSYRFYRENNKTKVEQIRNIHSLSIDNILKSEAFGLVSPFAPETQKRIDQYYTLKKKINTSDEEKRQIQLILPFIEEAFGVLPNVNPLEFKVQEFLKEKLNDKGNKNGKAKSSSET